MNRREAVSEVVRDTRGELSDGREAVLEAKLLLELFHGREVGEQRNGAVQLSPLIEQRRHGHAQVGGAALPVRQARQLQRAADDSLARGERLVDDLGEREL